MQVRMVLLDRVVNLLDEGIDVGIRIGRLDDSSQIAQNLGTMRRVVVASPGYLQQHGVPRHPRDLLGHNCVRFAPGQAGWTFRERKKELRVPVKGNLTFNQVAPIANACAAGLGFGAFLAYQVGPLVERGQLRVVLEKFEPPSLPISVVYPGARLLPARARAFIDVVRRELTRFKK
jgi:DNA-binding transcriptional LysR family regulator